MRGGEEQTGAIHIPCFVMKGSENCTSGNEWSLQSSRLTSSLRLSLSPRVGADSWSESLFLYSSIALDSTNQPLRDISSSFPSQFKSCT